MGERCGNAQLRGSAPGPCGETGYRQSTNCGVGLACDAGSRQSRAGSLLEATTHVAVGFGLALTGQQFVLPLFGIEVGLATQDRKSVV